MKVYLVTGAAQGLGRCIIERLCELTEADGTQQDTQLVLLDRDQKTLEKLSELLPASANINLFPMDLLGSTPDDYLTLRETVENEFGQLDGLFLNAAIFNGFTPIDVTQLEDWYEPLQTNLNANFHLIQNFLPLLASSQGTIVGITDQEVEDHPAYYGAYGVAKAGFEQLLNSVAFENRNNELKVYNAKLNAFQSKTRSKHFPSENPNTLPKATKTAEHLLDIVLNGLHSEQIERL